MLWSLTSIRGRLVLWYIGVLAVILFGLGLFQSIILGDSLRATATDNMRDTARTQLTVLGACFIRSPGDLRANAQHLAGLLGSREIAVKIVTPAGRILADHGFGQPGARQPMRLSAVTISGLIASARQGHTSGATRHSCVSHPLGGGYFPHRKTPPPSNAQSAVTSGGLLLMAVPLGPSDSPTGYAILGRSLANEDATVREARILFGLGALLALLVAALVALPIIDRALRPLYQVTRTAEAIAAGDLEKRANLKRSADEVGRLGIAFDTMVDRLQNALSVATRSEQRMRQFLADASHELRTPLTALRGTAEVLLRQAQGGSPEVDRALRNMHEETVRLSRLVDNLLTLSRLDAGESLEPRPIEVGPFLEGFLARFSQAWPNRAVTVDRSRLDSAVASVDPDALTRVLTNLVDNAVRYSTSPGPIVLTGEENQETVTVAVSDPGPGLEGEDARRMLERFYRGSKSRSRRTGGAGLGLAIVDALVQQSGGHLTVETAPDRGTTVSVTLPRLPNAVTSEPPAAAAARS